MILQTAAFLSAVGFVLWIVGLLLDYHAISIIGAALFVGVGAMIAANGLFYKAGEERSFSYTNTSNVTVTDNITIDHTYEQVSTPQQLSLGTLLALVGGLMATRTLDMEG